MAAHPLAGKTAPPELLVDLEALEHAYFDLGPDPADPRQRVAFGTSGHRGSALESSFNEGHILAITQAICDYRREHGVEGPLFLGKDTHALSGPAQRSALEVLAANGVHTVIQAGDGYTPTPVISRAIACHNRVPGRPRADGIVVTPSHNPPSDGGFKYNPPHGGPADSRVTGWIQERANALLAAGGAKIERIPYQYALTADSTEQSDLAQPYIEDLESVVDMQAIRGAGLRLGVDPLGGAAVHYWGRIAEHYGLELTLVNPEVDPRFAFMSVDHDGRIRMDCSSPWAMAGLVALKDRFQVAWGNDADVDRHGIVTPAGGLLNPNHYLAVAIRYLLEHRPGWSEKAAVGKTLVSSSLIDRVVAGCGRRLYEVPVGFKWFAPSLADGSCCFGGEESAGASFLRRDGQLWTADKDGLIMGLLAAELTAVSGRDPGEHYQELTGRYGTPCYTRIDAPATPGQKARLGELDAEQVAVQQLAGEPIEARLSRAPGNDAPIGGIKLVAANGWFAARPSGTEDVYKIYAESLLGPEHLEQIVAQAREVVDGALGPA